MNPAIAQLQHPDYLLCIDGFHAASIHLTRLENMVATATSPAHWSEIANLQCEIEACWSSALDLLLQPFAELNRLVVHRFFYSRRRAPAIWIFMKMLRRATKMKVRDINLIEDALQEYQAGEIDLRDVTYNFDLVRRNLDKYIEFLPKVVPCVIREIHRFSSQNEVL